VLIRDGEVDTPSIDPIETANLRQPRSAAGVSRDGRTVWLVVTDGRQEHSKGMTLYELARTLDGLGAWRGINLDGGGSSTIWVDRLGGVINTPSGSRWERRLGFGAIREEGEETGRVRYTKSGRPMVYVRGVEREVMNSIGVRAPAATGAPPIVRTAPLDMPADIPEVVALPPRTSSIRMGRWLERAPQAGCVAILLFLALWARKHFKFEKRISNVNGSQDSDA
jgi:exopolysaccharide biosynthesis protein